MVSRKPKTVLQFLKPSSYWGAMYKEALPCGNGLIGAAVYGGVANETVMLTHAGLKWQGYVGVLPEISEKVKEVEKLMAEGKPKQAQEILPNALLSKGYHPVPSVPLPVCDLKIKTNVSNNIKEYQRALNMETGECAVSYKDGSTKFERSLFVSRESDSVVMEITKSGTKTIDVELSFDMHDRTDAKTQTVISKLPSNPMTKYENFFMYYSAKSDDDTDFGAVSRVTSFGGTVEFNLDRLKIKGTDRVLIITKLFINSNKEKEWKKLKDELSVIKTTYDKLLKDHSAIHSKLFNAANIDLNCEDREMAVEQLLMDAYSSEELNLALIEKLWLFGRYLFISSTRSNGSVCMPFGLWCGEYKAANSYPRFDGVMQMLYSIAISGNMPEFLESVFSFCETNIADFKKNALRIYGARGIFVPSVTSSGTGLLGSVDPKDVHFTAGAGLVANMFYQYYLSTNDKKFLKERALPFMKEAILFYEDFLKLDSKGKYYICPNYSPKNTPGNYAQDSRLDIAENAMIDFAVLKELLNGMIDGANECKVYKDEVEKWQDMLIKIPEYKISDDKICEYISTQFTDNFNHRFCSHLYPCYPGLENAIGKDANNKYYKNAAMARFSNSNLDQTAQGYAYLSSVLSSMSCAEAFDCLEKIAKHCTMNNLVTVDNDHKGMGLTNSDNWAAYQIQGNIGFTAALTEMFVASNRNTISILPNLPSFLNNVSIENILTRCAVEVSIELNKKKGSLLVNLKPKKNCTISMYLPSYVKKINKGPVLKFDEQTFLVERIELLVGKSVQFDIKI